MMGMEIQEGKIRMARMRYCDEFPATTASALRLCALVGLGENNMTGAKPRRVVFFDAWFASVGTVKGVADKFGWSRINFALERTDLGRDLTLNGIFTANFFCGRIKAFYSGAVLVEPVKNVALCIFSKNQDDLIDRFYPLTF